MAALTPTLVKVETEGDLQVVYLTFSAVTDGDTYDASKFFKNVVAASICPNTSAGSGISNSSGTLTFKISTGTPSAFVRVAGN